MQLDRDAQAYLLTERELKVLLAGMNNDFVFGLLSDRAAECTETKTDIYAALADMIRMEKISSDGDRFQIAEPIASCVRQIGNAETVCLFDFCDADYPDCCYFGEEIVVYSRLRYQPEILRIKKYAREEFNALWQEHFDAVFADHGASAEEDLWNGSPTVIFSCKVFFKEKQTVTISVSVAPLSPPEIHMERCDAESSKTGFSKEILVNLIDYYIFTAGNKAQGEVCGSM